MGRCVAWTELRRARPAGYNLVELSRREGHDVCYMGIEWLGNLRALDKAFDAEARREVQLGIRRPAVKTPPRSGLVQMKQVGLMSQDW